MLWYRRAVMLLSIAFVAIGVALLVVATEESSTAGYVLGGVFVAVGVARITMERKRRSSQTRQ